MENKSKEKKQSWRFIVRIIAIVYIVYVWVEKDIVTVLTTIPKEQLVSVIAPHLVVSLIVLATIAGGIQIVRKMKKK